MSVERAREDIMHRFIKGSFFIIVLSAALLNGVLTGTAQTPTGAAAAAGRLSPAEAKKIIAARSLEVLRAIKQRDMRRLSSFVHPEKGLRFSPYVYVQSGDRVLTRGQVGNLLRNNRRYLWGEEDATGNPMRLTARQFFNKFIYDKDFLRAKQVNYNTQTGRGNTVNNILDFYPRAITVEYYLPGTNPRFGGMDWGSLWLVFEQHGTEWYLTGLASDEWTT
jgi:hypothetical protein